MSDMKAADEDGCLELNVHDSPRPITMIWRCVPALHSCRCDFSAEKASFWGRWEDSASPPEDEAWLLWLRPSIHPSLPSFLIVFPLSIFTVVTARARPLSYYAIRVNGTHHGITDVCLHSTVYTRRNLNYTELSRCAWNISFMRESVTCIGASSGEKNIPMTRKRKHVCLWEGVWILRKH